MLKGESLRVHPPDKPFGFELSGNQALFKGDLKLVRNIAPLGDGQWHLYDIRRDPGETNDLRTQRPQEFLAMQADYAEYARTHGVLPMPERYDPVQQVLINALINVYVPRFWPLAVALLAGLIALALFVRRRRRLRRS